jgi:hypothetical protein
MNIIERWKIRQKEEIDANLDAYVSTVVGEDVNAEAS